MHLAMNFLATVIITFGLDLAFASASLIGSDAVGGFQDVVGRLLIPLSIVPLQPA